MKFLFLFAHPDDETIGSGATIKQLVDAGHEVKVILATDGSGGEVSEKSQPALAKFGTLGALRRHEFAQVCKLLGIQQSKILAFADGEITNKDVWGKLLVEFICEIDAYKPDTVITFDHSGWYFHLDHVGVSIAATLAVQQSAHRPDLFFHNLFQVDGGKWQYVFNKQLPVTHGVDVIELQVTKLEAMDLHASQDLNTPRNHMAARDNPQELFQLVSSTSFGENWLKNQNIFKPIS